MDPSRPGAGHKGDPNLYTVPDVYQYRFGETDGDVRLNLEQERARQAKESADKLALENALTRGEVAPAEHFDSALFSYTSQVKSFLDAISANLRRKFPHIEERDHYRIGVYIDEERNRLSARLAGDSEADEVGDQESCGAAESTAAAET